MPEKTEAQRRAQKNYMEKFSVARVRMDKEKYEAVQAAAAAAGESVNAYINGAIDRRVSGEVTSALPSGALERAESGAKATGETVEAFIVRAVDAQIKRDSDALTLGINPANKGGENTSV